MEWQDISTAPKDCAFLGYFKICEGLWIIAPMYWSDSEFLFVEFYPDNTEHSAKPTHWMPIPDAPIE